MATKLALTCHLKTKPTILQKSELPPEVSGQNKQIELSTNCLFSPFKK